MKGDINFYEVEEGIIKALAPLLIKILDEKKRALIFSESESQIRDYDLALWSYGRSKFIPHATIFDKEFNHSRQPVLFTNQEENINSADYLIFFSDPSEQFVSKFSRAFHFFENSSAVSKIKPNSYFKKSEGKWQKLF